MSGSRTRTYTAMTNSRIIKHGSSLVNDKGRVIRYNCALFICLRISAQGEMILRVQQKERKEIRGVSPRESNVSEKAMSKCCSSIASPWHPNDSVPMRYNFYQPHLDRAEMAS